jgi:hypothetical protein
MKSAGFVLLVLSAVGNAYGVGECGAQFLKMGVGAKACAMGEAFAAVADDASAIYWNPAGLTQLDRIDVLVMQNFWLLDMSYQYAAVAVPTPIGAFGLTGAYSSSGTIPRYEEFRKTGEYSAYDAAGTVAYAGKVPGLGFGDLSFGIGAKYLQQQIDTFQARGFAGDVGLLYKAPVPIVDLKVGLAVQNIGAGIKFIERADPLPLNIKAGLGVRFGPVTLAADVNKPRDNELSFGTGGELSFLDYLFLRGGYNTAHSWSAGLGVMWKMVSIDYAFVPYKEIDATHRISARVRF